MIGTLGAAIITGLFGLVGSDVNNQTPVPSETHVAVVDTPFYTPPLTGTKEPTLSLTEVEATIQVQTAQIQLDNTATVSAQNTQTRTPTPIVTDTPTLTPTATETPTFTPTVTDIPTNTPTPSPSHTATQDLMEVARSTRSAEFALTAARETIEAEEQTSAPNPTDTRTSSNQCPDEISSHMTIGQVGQVRVRGKGANRLRSEPSVSSSSSTVKALILEGGHFAVLDGPHL